MLTARSSKSTKSTASVASKAKTQSTNSTPQTARVEEFSNDELPTDFVKTESIQESIQALTDATVVVFLVSHENAALALHRLVGPMEKEEKENQQHANTLQCTFGKESLRGIVFRSSKSSWAVEAEAQFFFRDFHRDLHTGLNSNGTPCKSDKVRPLLYYYLKKGYAHLFVQVSLTNLVNFLFPNSKHHPQSTGRLFVFALYGPLDEKSRLRSGEKGLHGKINMYVEENII